MATLTEFDNIVEGGGTTGCVAVNRLSVDSRTSARKAPANTQVVVWPLAVFDPVQPRVVMDAFIDAAEQAGVPLNLDFNGATQERAGYREQRAPLLSLGGLYPFKFGAVPT